MIDNIKFKLSNNKLGFGGQGMVYKVAILGLKEECVDKVSWSTKDRESAHRKINQAYNEFQIAKELSHPYLV